MKQQKDKGGIMSRLFDDLNDEMYEEDNYDVDYEYETRRKSPAPQGTICDIIDCGELAKQQWEMGDLNIGTESRFYFLCEAHAEERYKLYEEGL